MLKTELGRLRKANRRLYKSFNLKLDDHELLKQMLSYLKHKRLNPYDFETVRTDLLGMAQETSKRKQPLHELIGDDRDFCDSLVANCNKSRLSASLCEWLATLFAISFFVCLFQFFYSSGFSITISGHELFTSVFLWLVYFTLWTQIIPLPYAIFKHYPALFILIVVSWIALSMIFLRGTFLDNVLFTISGYAYPAVLSILALGYLGLKYAADTLAYRQSSFGEKNRSGV